MMFTAKLFTVCASNVGLVCGFDDIEPSAHTFRAALKLPARKFLAELAIRLRALRNMKIAGEKCRRRVRPSFFSKHEKARLPPISAQEAVSRARKGEMSNLQFLWLLLAVCSSCSFARANLRGVRDCGNSSDATPRILSRPKRYLIFPQGSNLQLVFCLTIGAYTKHDVVMGVTAALAWELPSKVDSKISDLLHRKSRSVMFPKLEAFLQSTGLDGRACVMRALCETSQRDSSEVSKGTFVQELLHAIFTLPRDGRRFERSSDQDYDDAYGASGDCQRLYPTCRHSIYDIDI
ncbi:hypothetical protein KM043_007925 [Ampulex compressa]|nr:hypothetical protein KM043_007925 [Ampulex compressa]